ncbi:MAG TPA: fibronectin type III domain-containing protein, partial [Solirubrobacteraceae bacterium]|nr:fibronectin type III domain-containing protein [Solirubrobacteraceae bacterium]
PFTGTGNICADPRLADDGDASSADVHETSASPTIDAGLDADVPGALTSDYYGSPREVADACPIAAGTVDIGAAELQPDCVPATPAAPTAVPATTSASVSFTPPADNGYPITSYTVTAQPGGEQATGAASPITVTGLAPDTAYTFTLTATNSQGTSAASAPSAPVTTLPAAAAPALSHLALSLISFIAARSGGPTTRRHGVGTVFTYQDSEAATSTLTFYRVKLGRRRHGACLARAKSCSIFKQVGSFTHVDVAGRNSVHFSGRVDGHSLRGGLYQVRIRASLDGATGNTVKIEFDVF